MRGEGRRVGVRCEECERRECGNEKVGKEMKHRGVKTADWEEEFLCQSGLLLKKNGCPPMPIGESRREGR